MAKIETLVDHFTGGLSNWAALPAPYTAFSMFTDAGSDFQYNVASGGLAAMYTSTDYQCTDSWYTVDLTNYLFTGTTSPSVFEILLVDSTVTTQVSTTLCYLNSNGSGYVSGSVYIQDAASGNTATFSPTGSLLVGWRDNSGTMGTFYSVDGGATWVAIGAGSDSALATSSPVASRFCIIAEGSSDSAAQVFTGTNFNVTGPPPIPVGPLNISTPVFTAHAAMSVPHMGIFVPPAHAHARLAVPTLIFNDLHIGDRSTNPHFTAHAAMPVTGASFNLGLRIDMPVATAHAACIPYTGITYGPPVVSVGAANVTARMLAPSVTMSPGPILLSVPTMIVTAGMARIMPIYSLGSYDSTPPIRGDHADYQDVISGLTGSKTYDMSQYYSNWGLVDNAPAGTAYGGSVGTLWIDYSSPVEVQFTITISFPSGGNSNWFLNIFQGLDYWSNDILNGITANSYEYIGQMGVGPSGDPTVYGEYVSGFTGTFTLPIGDTTIWLNTYDAGVGVTDHHATITWSAVPIETGLTMQIQNPNLDRAPDNLRVAVQGGDPNEYFKFTWAPPASTLIPSSVHRPITLATIKSDPEGNLLTGTIPIPACFHGSYDLICTGTHSNKGAEGFFNVLNDPLPQDSTSGNATPVAQTGHKWLFDDGRGTTWSMLINPLTASTVIPSRMLTNDTTTSGNGQNIFWEGVTQTVNWTFSGSLLQQSEYTNMMYFYNLNRKFYITDHHGVTYIVTMKSFDPKPKKDAPNNQWAFDYDCTAIIYGTV